eukprot:Rhum_TRINITY_DN14601_c9_g2::Rhum_TRINITY_DN14601_c9_g2_i1::g.104786::m.104786/K02219/CKS1; cyclin-dependent kinase regulatory subunit CKS1
MFDGQPLEVTKSDQVQDLITRYKQHIKYSDKYYDEDMTMAYRHVTLPKELKKLVPKRIMSEAEWRSLGVQQSYGWQHYLVHAPEIHVLCFRRDVTDDGALPPPQQHYAMHP